VATSKNININYILRQRMNENKGFDINQGGEFSDIMNNLIEYCKDHSGSRLIQKRYESGTDDEKNQIFDKISTNILSLAKDVFGNYVIQKILDNNTVDQEKNSKIMTALEGNIQELTLHMYGCRVIQKAIEVKYRFLIKRW
jgi:pumilio RNA-binding family